jgi:hypothetical protein
MAINRFFSVSVLSFVFIAALFWLSGCNSSDVDTDSKQHPSDDVVHLVTLDTLGGEEWPPVQVLEGETLEGRLQVPEKEGFDFLGWSTSGTEYLPYDFALPVESDFTLYALWTGGGSVNADLRHLTVHLNGGYILNVPLQRLDINFKAGKELRQIPRMNTPPQNVNEEVRFVAWNTQIDGRGEYVWPESELYEDMELYAIYGTVVTIGNNATVPDAAAKIACGNPNQIYYINKIAGNVTGWIPLCDDPDAPFRGIAYFSNPTSVTVTGISPARERQGFFGYAEDAVFIGEVISSVVSGMFGMNMTATDAAGGLAAVMKDSRVEHINLASSQGTSFTAPYAGGITGRGDNITIRNVFAGSNSTGRYAGGFAGHLKNSVIERVYVNNTVTASSGGSYVGNLVGYMEGGRISRVSHGAQNISGAAGSEGSYTGLIAGFLENADVDTVRVDGTYSVPLNDYSVGLIAGGMKGGVIKGASLNGTIWSPIAVSGAVIGGAVGRATDGAVIREVISSGNMSAHGPSSTVGGIVGSVDAASTVTANLVLALEINGTTAKAVAGTGPESGNKFRADISVNGRAQSGGVPLSQVRFLKSAFTEMGWNFEESAWIMSDYYDFPELKGIVYNSQNYTLTFRDRPPRVFIEVRTAEELAAIGDSADNLTKSYVLMNDIDATDREWTPISFLHTDSDYFSGVFMDNGHTISIKRTGSGSAGLFNHLRGKVTDLKLNVNFVCTGNCNTGAGGYGGGVTARNGGTVERVHVTGNIEGYSYLSGIGASSASECSFTGNLKGIQLLGGIAVEASGIYQCFSDGVIEVNSTTLVYAGGLARQADRVSNSYSSMSILALSNTTAGPSDVGGIIAAAGVTGYRDLYLNRNYASGNITVNRDSGSSTLNAMALVGGIGGTLTAGSINSIPAQPYSGAFGNVVMMESINVVNSAGNTYAGKVVGGKTPPSGINPGFITADNYVNPSMSFNVSGTLAPADTLFGIKDDGMNYTVLDEAFFADTLGWDMVNVWKWDSGKNRPIFLWQ